LTRLWLVRHGTAAAGFGADLDPGLSEQGVAEARRMAAHLAPRGPLPVVSSPLLRTRQTAAEVAAGWSVPVVVATEVTEVPSPTRDLAGRRQWLAEVLPGRWTDQAPALWHWRHTMLDYLRAVDTDTVVVTHMVAINAVLAEATGDDRVISQPVPAASLSVVDSDGATLRVGDIGWVPGDTVVGDPQVW
jgi:broad specificity phosphatase PhoE